MSLNLAYTIMNTVRIGFSIVNESNLKSKLYRGLTEGLSSRLEVLGFFGSRSPSVAHCPSRPLLSTVPFSIFLSTPYLAHKALCQNLNMLCTYSDDFQLMPPFITVQWSNSGCPCSRGNSVLRFMMPGIQ